MNKALILVDIQNDFLPGGALAVPDGDRIIPVANRIQGLFDLIVATRDWHPPDHGSFASNHPGKKPGDVIDLNGLEQILWPAHCVQNTKGAEFAASFETDLIEQIIYKGTDAGIDSYSTFFDNAHRKATGLHDYLKEREVTDIHIAGLATDYCVKFSVQDALELGYKTYVIEDGCRGVNLERGDSEKAFQEMKALGAVIIRSVDLPGKGSFPIPYKGLTRKQK